MPSKIPKGIDDATTAVIEIHQEHRRTEVPNQIPSRKQVGIKEKI